MAVYLPAEKKKDIFREHAGDENNTGSVPGQIALFTYRIQSLSAHLRDNPKDHATRRRLLTLVGKRRQLLNYYAKKDLNSYRALIEKLGIRK